MRKRTRLRLVYDPFDNTYAWLYFKKAPEHGSAEWHIWCKEFPSRDEAIDAYNERIAK